MHRENFAAICGEIDKTRAGRLNHIVPTCLAWVKLVARWVLSTALPYRVKRDIFWVRLFRHERRNITKFCLTTTHTGRKHHAVVWSVESEGQQQRPFYHAETCAGRGGRTKYSRMGNRAVAHLLCTSRLWWRAAAVRTAHT
ncbi:unnamed protein product [Ectocarpus sp. 12 AP-2014]